MRAVPLLAPIGWRGERHVIALGDVQTRVLLWNRLRRPPGTPPRIPLPGEMSKVRQVVIEIAGAPVDFTVLERDAAWIAQGDWRQPAVELEADHVCASSIRCRARVRCS
jgi:hypothetical protein